MYVSKRKQLANAKNARKSTGPRTRKGKARSARNALRHGLLAKSVLLHAQGAGEQQKDFDALLADLVADLAPRNMIEEALVERIATCYWRLRRAQRFESRAIDIALETRDPCKANIDDLRDRCEEQQDRIEDDLRLLKLLEIPLENRSHAQRTEIEAALKHYARFCALAPPRNTQADLEAYVRRLLSESLATSKALADRLHGNLRTAELQAPTASDPYATHVAPDVLLKIVRYESMLDRQIHRAMTELRRLRNAPSQKVPEE